METSTSESLPMVGNPPAIAPASLSVRMVDAQKVNAYLEAHRGMLDIAEAVCLAARQEFGPQAELCLQVYCDPEIADEYLALYVRLTSYGNDFLERIRAISTAHEEMLFNTSGHLLVTTDFRLPQVSLDAAYVFASLPVPK